MDPQVAAPPLLTPRHIDHTCLRPDASAEDIARLCGEAIAHAFQSVCVQPTFVRRASRAVAHHGVGVTAVVGFPHGAHTSATKIFEAQRAIDEGATELDVVANLGWIRIGDALALTHEIAAIVDAAPSIPIKVILETALFSEEQIAVAARAAIAAGAAFLKTSTGFAAISPSTGAQANGGGATVEHVRLLRDIAAGRALVKASGGIRTRDQALAMLAAGAARIGSSASVALLTVPPA